MPARVNWRDSHPRVGGHARQSIRLIAGHALHPLLGDEHEVLLALEVAQVLDGAVQLLQILARRLIEDIPRARVAVVPIERIKGAQAIALERADAWRLERRHLTHGWQSGRRKQRVDRRLDVGRMICLKDPRQAVGIEELVQ